MSLKLNYNNLKNLKNDITNVFFYLVYYTKACFTFCCNAETDHCVERNPFPFYKIRNYFIS